MVIPILLLLLFFASASGAEPTTAEPDRAVGLPKLSQPDSNGLQRLVQETGGQVVFSQNPATGVVGFLRITSDAGLSLTQTDSPQAETSTFLQQYGGIFGVTDATTELVQVDAATDSLGMKHLTYQQVYEGVPVFAGILRVHLNENSQLTAANGVFVPRIKVNTTPSLTAETAAEIAVAATAELATVDGASAGDLSVATNTLYVYRDGLLQGVPGANYLVYEVQVTNQGNIRDFVYVDAHAGNIINHVSAVDNALFRRLYEMNTGNQVWKEGDPFPGALNGDQQNIVNYSGDSYRFFNNAFGRDSYDAAGAEMRSVNNDPTISCPNANWNGSTTNYCNGVTSDDVVSHEWGHAYTEYTSNLIYQWQPGALNESYSDIWGETIDMINGVGTDAPAPVRTVNSCSTFEATPPVVIVNSPGAIAGTYAAASASFGPPVPPAGLTGNVVLGDDGVGVGSDACTPLVNGAAVAGNLALVDRGTCPFTVKVKNTQDAGATGVIVANNAAGPPAGMSGVDPSITIPSLQVSQATGNLIKGALPGVNATLAAAAGASPQASYRWLMGEDSTAFGGAIRDMWNPTCKADAGKVSDAEYQCAATDGGGVHSNSGVPNHGYALLVDGGTYNGQTITGIGLTKAAHIYWRAQAVYQTPTTKFADHADALEAACTDLIGQNLQGLSTSVPAGPSGQIITVADCGEVSDMIDAVELRTDPAAQCGFEPLLEQDPPALCATDVVRSIYSDDFESGLGDWTLTNQGVYSGWPSLNWTQDTSLPGGRPGAAAFGIDLDAGNCNAGNGDISGVMRMASSAIAVPAANTATTRLVFDHYIATELGWDGGNLKMSVNGGAYNVVPAAAFTFNPYNANLQTAGAGNTNPLAGQPAFTGTDEGEVGGSWGQSQVNLGAAGVSSGDTISLRYDMGMDGCTGIDGWYVDDVNVYSCEPNQPPVCSGTVASTSRLWPANHKFISIDVLGVTDAEGDPVTITIDSIRQDEAVDANGSGNTAPDGQGVGTSTAQVRAERVGNGNGRVYYISFTAEDLYGGACSGQVQVGVPKNSNGTAVGDGPNYDSTVIP
ncbi:MAG: M4 family metallopeptidase [Candidatus Promineofilum sp.]|nr:M4 family metallopeptidase [Promineifilum sp.]